MPLDASIALGAQQQQQQQNPLAGIASLLQIVSAIQQNKSRQLADQKNEQMTPLQLQLLQMQIKNQEAQGPEHAAKAQKAQIDALAQARSMKAQNELVGLIDPNNRRYSQGSVPNKVFLSEADARAQALAADARGETVRNQSPNQNEVQQLLLQAYPKEVGKELSDSFFGNPKAATSSPLSKLIDERNSLPANDPRIAIYNDAITKSTTHQPPVNVYSGGVTAGVRPDGEPVFIQPSGRDNVNPRVIDPNIVRPRPTASEEKATNAAITSKKTFESIDRLAAELQRDIAAGEGTATGTVGIKGAITRVMEAGNAVLPGQAFNDTPALNVQSRKELLIGQIKELFDKGVLSNQDKQRIESALGVNRIITSPRAAINGIGEVRKILAEKKHSAGIADNIVPPNSDSKPKAEDFFRK